MTILRRWRSALLAVLIVIGVVIAHRTLPDQPSRLLGELIRSLHGPGFAVIASMLFLLIGPLPRVVMRYIAAGTAAALIAGIAEAAQIPGARDAQVSDLIVDGIGIVGALAAIAVIDPRASRSISHGERSFLAVFGASALVVTCAPTLWYAYVIVSQRNAMPEMLTFEHRWEASTYWQTANRHPERLPAPTDWPADGSTIGYTREDGRSGILIRLHPYPDWRGYSAVSFVAASTSDGTHKVAVGIRDMREKGEKKATRLDTGIDVGPEPRRYRIVLAEMRNRAEEPIDLAHIETLVLSAAKPGSDIAVLVDDFRLEE